MKSRLLMVAPTMVMLLLMFNSYGKTYKEDHVVLNKPIAIPIEQVVVYTFALPKDATLRFSFTQDADQQVVWALYHEGSYKALERILQSGEGDPLSVTSLLHEEGTELQKTGVDLSKGDYFLCLQNLSEKDVTLKGKIIANF